MLIYRFFFLLALNFIPLVAVADLDVASTRLFLAQVARAEKGESNDQYYLGEMYEQGLGTKADMNKALEWYRKAADQGNALARRKLSDLARANAAQAEKAKAAREKERAERAVQAGNGAAAKSEPGADNEADDLAARRKAAKLAYEKARAQQKKAGGLWQ